MFRQTYYYYTVILFSFVLKCSNFKKLIKIINLDISSYYVNNFWSNIHKYEEDRKEINKSRNTKREKGNNAQFQLIYY